MDVHFGEPGQGQSYVNAAVTGACNTPAVTIPNETTASKERKMTALCQVHLLTKKEK